MRSPFCKTNATGASVLCSVRTGNVRVASHSRYVQHSKGHAPRSSYGSPGRGCRGGGGRRSGFADSMISDSETADLLVSTCTLFGDGGLVRHVYARTAATMRPKPPTNKAPRRGIIGT